MKDYDLVFNEAALRFLLSQKKAERLNLLAFFEAMTKDPGRVGDFYEISMQGRRIGWFQFGPIMRRGNCAL